MFTGLIEEVGTVKAVRKAGTGLTMEISAEKVLRGTVEGDSISINGACQTVTAADESSFSVFVSSVTASITTLGGMKPGTRVNLERAMSHESRFGGHIVQGHVDIAGTIEEVRKDSHGEEIAISISGEFMRYIVPRGSIAVDGISLTVVAVKGNGFSLYIIPETLKNTVVDQWRPGAQVNIEVDILAKYVEKMLQPRGEGPASNDENLKRKLAEGGFI